MFERLETLSNPFFRQVVGDAWEPALADVPGIHGAQFRQFLHLIEEVRRQRRSAGLLLKGSAGAGKTHLLSRLRSTLEAERRSVVFVSLYMATAPTRIWRHVRRHFANSLLRPWADGHTQLDLLLRAKPHLGGLNYSLSRVLEHYRTGGDRELCAAWLRGDDLPAAGLDCLGVTDAQADEDETREDAARNVVLALAKLADPAPVVLCCDQAEALQTVPGDPRGFWTYGQVVSDLQNELDNVLLISCIQSVFAGLFEEAVHSSAWQRLAQFQSVLNPLTWEEGVSVLEARLRMAGVPRTGESPVWPLEEQDLREVFEDGRCLARKLLQRAGELFEVAREQPVPEIRPLSEHLNDLYFAARQRASQESPQMNADAVLDDGLPQLLDLAGYLVDRPDRAGEFNLEATGNGGSVLISFCNQPAQSVWRRLERATRMPEVDIRRLVLIRDSRKPVGAHALRTRRFIRTLEDRGARVVQPTPETLTALKALRQLLADAMSGNVSHRGETVVSSTVRDWMAAHLPIELRDLLARIEPQNPLPPSGQETLDLVMGRLAGRYIMRVDELANALQTAPERIEDCARQNPGQLGYLAGPPAIVFAVVARGHAEA